MKSLLTASVLLALSPLALAAEKLLVITPMGSEPPVRSYAQAVDGVVGVEIPGQENAVVFVSDPHNPQSLISSRTEYVRTYVLHSSIHPSIQNVPLTPSKTFFFFKKKQELHPSPKGMMSSPTGPERGYLLPINNTSVHEFQFTPTPPRSSAGPTPKYKNFFSTGAGCGAMCGGPQLVYDETPEDDAFSGQWLLEERGVENGGGYFVRWYNGPEAFPEGYRTCYLMREQEE